MDPTKLTPKFNNIPNNNIPNNNIPKNDSPFNDFVYKLQEKFPMPDIRDLINNGGAPQQETGDPTEIDISLLLTLDRAYLLCNHGDLNKNLDTYIKHASTIKQKLINDIKSHLQYWQKQLLSISQEQLRQIFSTIDNTLKKLQDNMLKQPQDNVKLPKDDKHLQKSLQYYIAFILLKDLLTIATKNVTKMTVHACCYRYFERGDDITDIPIDKNQSTAQQILVYNDKTRKFTLHVHEKNKWSIYALDELINLEQFKDEFLKFTNTESTNIEPTKKKSLNPIKPLNSFLLKRLFPTYQIPPSVYIDTINKDYNQDCWYTMLKNIPKNITTLLNPQNNKWFADFKRKFLWATNNSNTGHACACTFIQTHIKAYLQENKLFLAKLEIYDTIASRIENGTALVQQYYSLIPSEDVLSALHELRKEEITKYMAAKEQANQKEQIMRDNQIKRIPNKPNKISYQLTQKQKLMQNYQMLRVQEMKKKHDGSFYLMLHQDMDLKIIQTYMIKQALYCLSHIEQNLQNNKYIQYVKDLITVYYNSFFSPKDARVKILIDTHKLNQYVKSLKKNNMLSNNVTSQAQLPYSSEKVTQNTTTQSESKIEQEGIDIEIQQNFKYQDPMDEFTESIHRITQLAKYSPHSPGKKEKNNGTLPKYIKQCLGIINVNNNNEVDNHQYYILLQQVCLSLNDDNTTIIAQIKKSILDEDFENYFQRYVHDETDSQAYHAIHQSLLEAAKTKNSEVDKFISTNKIGIATLNELKVINGSVLGRWNSILKVNNHHKYTWEVKLPEHPNIRIFRKKDDGAWVIGRALH